MNARAQRKARRELVEARSAEREARGRNKKSASRLRRVRRKVGAVLVETLAPWILRALAKTWRITRTGKEGQALFMSDARWICATWHGRMLTLMPLTGHCRRDISVLVSPSDDGGLANRALAKFRYSVVRGSLSKRGARAMREMLNELESGAQLGITPDGPRGPRHTMNIGPAWLARATGAPLLTVSVAVDRAWRFRSWDRMTLPKPFARVRIHYGDPVTVASDSTEEELERISQSLRERLLAAEREAFGALGAASDLEETTTPDEAATPGDRTTAGA